MGDYGILSPFLASGLQVQHQLLQSNFLFLVHDAVIAKLAANPLLLL